MKQLLPYLFIILYLPLSSNQFELDSFDADKGEIIEVYLKGSISEQNIESLKMIIKYDFLMLDFKMINYQEENISIISQSNNNTQEDGFIYIEFEPQVFDTKDNFFALEFEVLAGPRVEANIDIISITNQDDERIEAQNLNGIINISNPVFETPNFDLGNFYPNPANNLNKVNLSINREVKAHFSLYSLDGKKIQIPLCYNDCNDNLLRIFNSQGEKENFEDNILKQGNYTLEIEFYSGKISSGSYLFVAKLNDIILSKKFMIVK